MRQNVVNRVLTAIVMLFLLMACTDDCEYYQYRHVPLQGWEKNDTMSFDVPPVARPGIYSTTIGLRTTAAYPFTKLCLVVEQTLYPSKQKVTQEIVCDLVDKDGRTTGNGVSYYQYEIPSGMVTTLAPNDSIHYLVRHNMKRSVLPGVSDVGIKLTRNKK